MKPSDYEVCIELSHSAQGHFLVASFDGPKSTFNAVFHGAKTRARRRRMRRRELPHPRSRCPSPTLNPSPAAPSIRSGAWQ